MRNVLSKLEPITYDASSRLRTSQLYSLFDGKILGSDNTLIFDNQGTGTGTYANNKYNMSVTSGQYLVRQGKLFCQYSSGKSQFVEMTFDNFQIEANVTKRVGYFTSSAVVPYDASLDGFFLENDGTTFRIKCFRNGTETVNIAFVDWDGYNELINYNWSNFTVIAFDFLWLGGAILRMFVKTERGFVLAHTVNWAGSATDTFILSPNKPIRYEIRSSTGTGSLRYICSQVSTEGQLTADFGFNNSVNTGATNGNPTVVALPGAVTQYALLGIRKQTARRDVAVRLFNVNFQVPTANDRIFWTVQKNPIIAGTFTYNNLPNSAIQYASGAATNTITTTGKIIASGFYTTGQAVDNTSFLNSYFSYLTNTINDTMESLVLVAYNISGAADVLASMSFKEDA